MHTTTEKENQKKRSLGPWFLILATHQAWDLGDVNVFEFYVY